VLQDRIERAFGGIGLELQRPTGERVAPEPQLRHIRQQLQAMREQLVSGPLPPRQARVSMLGRIITDSWPLESELGSLLIAIEREYLALP
jgi:hypothetical protein